MTLPMEKKVSRDHRRVKLADRVSASDKSLIEAQLLCPMRRSTTEGKRKNSPVSSLHDQHRKRRHCLCYTDDIKLLFKLHIVQLRELNCQCYKIYIYLIVQKSTWKWPLEHHNRLVFISWFICVG